MENSGFAGRSYTDLVQRFRIRRGLLFGLLIIAALLAFEIFNYTTTDYALSDLLGELRFLGIRWATILAIAFCGIDFAGIARLFTPEEGADEPTEVWYLFGAWMLAATMNAMLTWWGVSLAVVNHQDLGNAVIDRTTLVRVVPIFVAIMVWLIRVLIIGTFSVAGDRLFSQSSKKLARQVRVTAPARRVIEHEDEPVQRPQHPPLRRPTPTSIPAASGFRNTPSRPTRNNDTPNPRTEGGYSRPEPSYIPMSMSPKSNDKHTRR
jgi:hypothetical protein